MSLKDLTEAYLENKDKELIPTIYSIAVEEVGKWMKYQKKVRYNEFPDGFATEVALEFIVRLYEDRITNTPLSVILSIARSFVGKYVYTKFSDDVKGWRVVSPDVEEDLLTSEFITKQLEDLSQEVKAKVIYLLVYPEEFQRVRNLQSNTEFYLGMIRMYKIKGKFSVNKYNFPILPQTQISKILLLSALYKQSPALMIMFLLMGDTQKFLQFCSLFGGSSFQVPESGDLTKIISNVSSLVSELEKKDLSEVLDSDTLMLLCMEGKNINTKVNVGKLTPVVELYIEHTINSLVDNYNKLQDRLVTDLNLCDQRELKDIYKVLTNELSTQFMILKSLFELTGG